MRTKPIFLLVLLALALPASPAQAGGVVAICDEAHLRAALAGGGTVTFTCSGTIVLTNTITIADDTSIDGGWEAVTISGNDAVRVFTVQEGAALTLNALTVAHGRSDNGGGVHNSGALTVTDSVITGNSAGNGGAIFIPVCYADCGDISVTMSSRVCQDFNRSMRVREKASTPSGI